MHSRVTSDGRIALSSIETIEQYESLLANLASEAKNAGLNGFGLVERDFVVPDSLTAQAVGFHAEMIAVEADRKQAGWILQTGLFNAGTPTNAIRLSAFCVGSEVSKLIEAGAWGRSCTPYSEDDELFREAGLVEVYRDIVYDNEIVKFDAEVTPGSRHVSFFGGYARIATVLDPVVVAWVRRTWPSLPLWIRLEPDFFSMTKPVDILFEQVIRPIDPSWWPTLSLASGRETSARYFLPAEMDKENLLAYWEYHAIKIRSLEVQAKRNAKGNLSVMYEELVQEDEDLVIGRMVHLDTDDQVGTSNEKSTLNHLDLAINVYRGEAARDRLRIPMTDPGAIMTKTRTHVLRIQGIPFDAQIMFALLFLKSTVLKMDWIMDQFRTGGVNFVKPDQSCSSWASHDDEL